MLGIPERAPDIKPDAPMTKPENLPPEYEYNSMALDAGYQQMGFRAMTRQPDDFDFDTFRGYYVFTTHYDPLGKEAKDRLFELVYKVQNSKTEADAQKYLEQYQNLIFLHLANLEIVKNALGFSIQDRRFGNPNFFRWMYKGLLDVAMAGRDGRTLASGYVVAAVGEETEIIRALGLQVLGSKTVNEYGAYYSIYEVGNPKTGQQYPLFFDLGYPMLILKKREQDKGFAIRIAPQ